MIRRKSEHLKNLPEKKRAAKIGVYHWSELGNYMEASVSENQLFSYPEVAYALNTQTLK